MLLQSSSVSQKVVFTQVWYLRPYSYLQGGALCSPNSGDQPGLCCWVPRSHRKTALGRLPPRRLRHTASLSVKKAYLFVLGLRLRGSLWFGTSRVLQSCCQETYIGWEKPSLRSLPASLHLPGISQTGAYTLLRNPDFYNCCPVDMPRSPGTGGQ